MNCHNQVLADDPRLALVRETPPVGSEVGADPPGADYVYFSTIPSTSIAGSVVSSHGPINQMEEVYHFSH